MDKKHSLPKMDLTFDIQTKGDETDQMWVGTFTYRRPTLKERAMVDVLRARLNGDLNTIDPDTALYNEAIAHLRFTLREYPTWWKDSDFGGNLYDANVILDIYNKCLEFEQKWRDRVFGGKSEAVEEGKHDEGQEIS